VVEIILLTGISPICGTENISFNGNY